MNLFDDDFYSTKVSRRAQRTHRHSMVRGRSAALQGNTILLIILAMLLGACLMWIALTAVSGKKQDAESVPIAANAERPDYSTAPFEDHYRLAYDQLIIQATGKVQPAVVSIISSLEDKKTSETMEIGLGSGILFKKEKNKALIVTNDHVIQQAELIEVVLHDGDRKKATLVGTDTLTDLAVLEVDAEGIEHYAEFGNSSVLVMGETAIAIGNPLGLGFSHSVTVGVISAPKRLIDVSANGTNDWKMDVIQTDAAINHGNSGGALVNLRGEVIGINSMKVLDMGVEGLGFAIPINDAQPILADLMNYGKVKRPYLGVYTANVESYFDSEELNLPKGVKTGIIVLDAVGPAKVAGMKTNDVIYALDGREVNNTYELRKYLYDTKRIDDDLIVSYYRDGKKQEVTVTLTEWNPDE